MIFPLGTPYEIKLSLEHGPIGIAIPFLLVAFAGAPPESHGLAILMPTGKPLSYSPSAAFLEDMFKLLNGLLHIGSFTISGICFSVGLESTTLIEMKKDATYLVQG